MTAEELRRRKKKLGLTNEQLAERSGVPLGTVQKVLAGLTKRPRKDTILALENALRIVDEDRFTDSAEGNISSAYSAACDMPYCSKTAVCDKASPSDPAIYDHAANNKSSSAAYRNVAQDQRRTYPDRLGEAAPEYYTSVNRKYTIADYYALPPERREELIGGVFYDMGAPTAQHQFFVGKIFRVLDQFVESRGVGCLPFISPIDVQLNRDGYTMVQPDILVLCDRDKLDRKAGRILGAPDLIIEVMSPSTARKDKAVKLEAYTSAGVREYWLVDIRHRRVIVNWLDEESDPEREFVRVFTFSDKIPVGIWQDQCLVDMAEIAAKYDVIYGTGA